MTRWHLFRAWKLYILTLGLAAILLVDLGCAHSSLPEKLPDRVTDTGETLGAKVHWYQGGPEDIEVNNYVQDLVSEPLDLAAVVQIGLLRNPELQAHYEELGISQADLVQAGLLSNPVFAATVRFPDRRRTRSGETSIGFIPGEGITVDSNVENSINRNNIEFAIVQSFLDLLMIPTRKQMAQARYEVAQLRVSYEVLAFAGELKKAYYEYVAAAQLAELAETAATATEAASELALRQYEAGNLSRLQLARETAFHAEALLDVDRARQDLRIGRDKLGLLMGLWESNVEWDIDIKRIPELPEDERVPEDPEAHAIANRLDLAARVRNLEALAYGVELERKWRWLGLLDLSVSTERDTDGVYVTGPTLELQLPIFDQGQAKILAADSGFRAESQRVSSLAIQVRFQTRRDLDTLLTNRERVEYMERVILPAYASIIDETQRHNNAMLIGVYDLLLDKRAQIDAGRRYVEALRDYWIARAELEMTLGGAIDQNLAEEVIEENGTSDMNGHAQH